MSDQRELRLSADHVVIAAGGICGGDLSMVRRHWPESWGSAPELLLNGAHKFGDGLLHEQVAAIGGAVTHLDLHWNYAAGVHNPKRRRPADGLSLVPPRSALWFNARGERIMAPGPMAAYGDTRVLVETVLQQPGQYSWQVLNWKIALRELNASGPEYLTPIVEKSWPSLAAMLLFGNKRDVQCLIEDCAEDIVAGDSLDELIVRMQSKSLYGIQIDAAQMRETITAWDAMIERGRAFHND